MKFVVSQEDLSKALLATSKTLPLKATLPVLANFALSALDGKLEIISTNLEAATKVTIDGKISTKGKITLPGRVFLEFVTQLPNKDVNFELLGTEAVVSSGGYKARFSTSPYEEFPTIPKTSSGITVGVGAEVLVEAINRISFAAAQDEGRPILAGLLFELTGKKLSLVATDGYRLGFAEVVLEKDASSIKFVAPIRAISELAKIIAETGAEKKFSFNVSENLSQASFSIGNVEYTTRLIEGVYPTWKKIIPAEFSTKAKLDREEFARQMKVASIFARDSGSIVKLKFEGKTMTISSSTSQVASGEIKVDIEMEGKGGEIAFNYRYVLEALAAIDSEDINIELNESLNPGKLTPAEAKPSFFHIVMPVRLQG